MLSNYNEIVNKKEPPPKTDHAIEGIKPNYRQVNPETIPSALKAITRWIVWSAEFDLSKHKWKKRPYSPITGLPINSKKPLEEQVGSFEQVIQACCHGLFVQGASRNFDGVGIYPNGNLLGIDIDKCVDGQGRIVIPFVRKWADRSNSYVELSPTVTNTGGDHIGGIRGFALGRKPGTSTKVTRDGISLEMYQGQNTYLTVTGHSLNGKPVVEDQDAIDAFHTLMVVPRMNHQKQNFSPISINLQDKTDDQILNTMYRTARDGDRIKRLYLNGTLGGDHSAEDYELLEALAFFTGDPDRTEQLFRSSAMVRKNGKGKNYLRNSIAKIFKEKKRFFDWNQNTNVGSSKINSVHGVPGVPTINKGLKNDELNRVKGGTPLENGGVPGVPGFLMTEEGLYVERCDQKGSPLPPEFICSPIQVLAQTRSENQNDWGLWLEWKDPDCHVHRWSAPKRALVGDGLDFFRELTDRGLRIAPGRKALNRLTEYLQAFPVERRVVCTGKTGWHDGVYVLPNKTIGGANKDQVIFQTEYGGIEDLYRSAGTVDEWRENVSFACRDNSRLILGISTAFAAPLLYLTGVENGGFHIVGPSSTGKTTSGTVAGSVFGGKEMKQNWNSTVNALGAAAILFNDAIMVLDELSQCEPKAAGETSYLLANGIEKGRANRNGSMKRRQQYRLLFISNGEIDLAQHLQTDGKKIKAGQDVRLLTIPADAGAGIGIFENLNGHPNPAAFADALKTNSLRYYGTAGPAFIEKISVEIDAVKGKIEVFKAQFIKENVPQGAESQVVRAAARFALIAIAGELATHYGITGWNRGDAVKAIEICFKAWLGWRGGIGNQEDRMFLEQIREHFERYGESRYSLLPDEGRTIHDRAGFREATGDDGSYDYFVLPKVFNADICNGVDRRQAVGILERLGILIIGSDGKKSIRKNLPGLGRTRCYQIRGERLFDEH